MSQYADEWQRQQSVRDCMAERGWTYVPIDPTASQAPSSLLRDQDAAAFVRRFGYGYTTELTQPAFVDPNRSYVESLSPAAQRRFKIDLGGQLPPNEAEPALEATSCNELARQRSVARRPWLLDDAFNRALNDAQQRVETDSRVLYAMHRWASCMAASGYDYPDQKAARLKFIALRNALLEDASDTAQAAAVATEELRTASVDATCEASSGLAAMRLEVASELRRELVERFGITDASP